MYDSNNPLAVNETYLCKLLTIFAVFDSSFLLIHLEFRLICLNLTSYMKFVNTLMCCVLLPVRILPHVGLLVFKGKLYNP